jgi:hypothetical protein
MMIDLVDPLIDDITDEEIAAACNCYELHLPDPNHTPPATHD